MAKKVNRADAATSMSEERRNELLDTIASVMRQANTLVTVPGFNGGQPCYRVKVSDVEKAKAAIAELEAYAIPWQ